MTIGQLIESLMGKACVLHGGFGNCTAYTNNGTKHESFGSVLTEYGFHSSGTEVLYNGMTGEQIKSDIYIGPTYYMRLKQMVKDKINYRSQGPRTQLTRQTVQGRANDGGLRVGEMERDGILGHGAAHFLNESLMVRGDEYHMAVCNKSGMIAIYNPAQNLFMSPMVDGPIQFSGSLTDAAASGGAAGAGAAGASVVHMTKFGRSFSIVRIPYCLKLLMQELIVMNVQMRIITEDNIDQLPSMSYSKNVYKVLKDGKGAMGVDDIIERNRLAAGLKPRDMAALARKDATSASVVGGPARSVDEEEATTGSRVYLPSRSEQEEEERRTAGNVTEKFDPDERIDEIITDLDIDTKQSIRNLGWRFALKADVIRQLQGSTSGAANSGKVPRIIASDINGEDLVLESVILDKNGEPTERWTISGRQWIGDYPTRYPDGWLSEMLVYPDDTPISPSDMVEELRNTRKPLNWVTAIISIMGKYARRKLANSRRPVESENVALSENEQKIAENERETARVSSEIERAKREGNVADEERLKVQMERLTDERTRLDAIRREMEREYVPTSPVYTSSMPTPPGTGQSADEEAEQVRRAVGSFNAKMLEKYGENDENIPESEGNSPRTPSSPAYTSMFEGGARQQRGGGGKFVPQIPPSVLDNYLNSKYGVSPKHTTVGISDAQSPAMGMMMGGAAGGLPMMNIPVVATMPMAGMMPVQPQQGGGGVGGAVATGTQPTAQQTQQVTNGEQSGGAGSGEPNAQGVRTFSIKL
jgi:hypothetical protein